MKKKFNTILSALRREKGLSQQRASADLGVSQSLLSHYENGTREPKLDFVIRACSYYGVTADYILGRSKYRGDKTPILIEIIKDFIAELDEMKTSGDALLDKLKELSF